MGAPDADAPRIQSRRQPFFGPQTPTEAQNGVYDSLEQFRELYQGHVVEDQRLRASLVQLNLETDLHWHLRDTYGDVRPEGGRVTAEVLSRLEEIDHKLDKLLIHVGDGAAIERCVDALIADVSRDGVLVFVDEKP